MAVSILGEAAISILVEVVESIEVAVVSIFGAKRQIGRTTVRGGSSGRKNNERDRRYLG